jgi:hypothetical protein
VEFDEIAGESQYVAGARVAASRVKVLNLVSNCIPLGMLTFFNEKLKLFDIDRALNMGQNRASLRNA